MGSCSAGRLQNVVVMKKNTFEKILVSENSQVLTVTLNRPDLRNAMDPQMIQELTVAFTGFAKRKDIRAVVLKGAGQVFCAGADLNWMKSMAKFTKPQNKKDSEKLFNMFQAIASCPHPVISEVHGAVYAGGLGLIAASDIVVADKGTKFCFSEVKLGLVPAVISHFVLQKTTLGAANPWMLTGKVFGTVEAQSLDLVHFSTDSVSASTNDLLTQLLESGPEAVRETKKLLKALQTASPAQAKTKTTSVIAERRVSAEGQEGLQSFLNKRPPSYRKTWSGS